MEKSISKKLLFLDKSESPTYVKSKSFPLNEIREEETKLENFQIKVLKFQGDLLEKPIKHRSSGILMEIREDFEEDHQNKSITRLKKA